MNLVSYARALGISEKSLTVVGEGENGIVLSDGSGTAFKFPKHELGLQSLRHEIEMTAGISHFLSVQVPEYLAVELDRPIGEAFCTYHLLAGERLTPEIYGRNRQSMSRQLLKLMDEIHDIRPAEKYENGMDYGAMYREIQTLLFPKLSDGQKKEITTEFERYLHGQEQGELSVCVVHGDLGCSNILCDKESGRITGIIDWAEISLDDPAVDYSALTCRASIPACREDLLALRPSLAELFQRSGFIQYTFPLQEALHCIKNQDIS